ncbi:MAG: histidine phosphatase family protein [Pseudomonadota bacterium]
MTQKQDAMTAPMIVTSWWLIRHGPVINPGQEIYGQKDVALDTSRPELFAAAARLLPKQGRWFASPLSRTMETARRLGGRDMTPIPELIEQNFGTWQGRRSQEVPEREQNPFWECPAHQRPEKGESFTDVTARVAPALEQISRHHGGETLICVAHGGSIRAALTLAGVTPETALGFSIHLLSVTRLDHLLSPGDNRSQWRVAGVNLTSASFA